MKLTLKRSREIKGIGIVLIMMLHFWYAGNFSWITTDCVREGIIPISLYKAIGAFCSMCTSVFAFLTGYTFWVAKEKWDKSFYRVKKIGSTLLEYWMYLALFLLIGGIAKEPLPDIKNVILSVLALNTTVGAPYVNVVFGWYISFYIFLIIIYPLINKINHWRLWKMIIGYAGILFLCKFLKTNVTQEWMWTSFWDRACLIVAVGVGGICAKYEVFEKIYEKLKKNCLQTIFSGGVITGVLLLLRVFTGVYLKDIWGTVYTVYIILAYFLIAEKMKPISRVLNEIGTYSMGMWLISGIFFLPSGEFLKFAYFPRYLILVLIWVLLSTYTFAKVIQYLENKVRMLFISAKIVKQDNGRV